jgi:hypothetical protein
MQALQLRDTKVTGNTAVTSGGGLLLGAFELSPEASNLPVFRIAHIPTSSVHLNTAAKAASVVVVKLMVYQ